MASDSSYLSFSFVSKPALWLAAMVVMFIKRLWEACDRIALDDDDSFFNSFSPFHSRSGLCKGLQGNVRSLWRGTQRTPVGWILENILFLMGTVIENYILRSEGFFVIFAIGLYQYKDILIAWAEYLGLWPLTWPSSFGIPFLDSALLDNGELPELEDLARGTRTNYRERMNGTTAGEGGDQLRQHQQHRPLHHHHACHHHQNGGGGVNGLHGATTTDIMRRPPSSSALRGQQQEGENDDHKGWRAPWCCEQCGQAAAAELTASKKVRPEGWLVYDQVLGVVPYEVLEQWRVEEERRSRQDEAGGGGGSGEEEEERRRNENEIDQGGGGRGKRAKANCGLTRMSASSSQIYGGENNHSASGSKNVDYSSSSLRNSSSSNNLRQRPLPPVRRPPP